jgi:hypothetical protein
LALRDLNNIIKQTAFGFFGYVVVLYLFIFEMWSHVVARGGLELLVSSDSPASDSQGAGPIVHTTMPVRRES